MAKMNIKNVVIFLTALITMVSAHAKWAHTLVWNEEFNGKQIDLNNWNIEDEKQMCTGNYIGQLQCHTANNDNVRVNGGVLSIIARKENRLDKEFTSAKINTKFGFTYGKVEIKASLPRDKMLRPAIWLLPETDTLDWPKNGQINIMTNTQTNNISSGVHYYNNGPFYFGGGYSGESLNEFHIYQIEWTPDYIEWFFDGNSYFKFETNRKLGEIYERNGQPFDHNFQIYFQLGIGGKFFPGLDLTEEDVLNWNCPLFIIDYVRVYRMNDIHGENENMVGKSVTQPIDESDKSVDCICAQLMSKLTPNITCALNISAKLSKSSIVYYIPLLTILVILFSNL